MCFDAAMEGADGWGARMLPTRYTAPLLLCSVVSLGR